MKKTLMLSAAAAAFLLAGGGAAWAQCDEPLPNPNWKGYDVAQTVGTLSFNSGGNGHAEVTTRCNAINPGNQVDPDHSYDLASENVLICQRTHGLTEQGAELGFTADACS